jgi:AcrR family transcriptional regulator
MTGTETKEKRGYEMRVRARRSEATARRILDEAVERFLSRPYDEVTLAEIARAAGVTVPTLIAHFGRKDELFAAASQDRYEQVTRIRDEAPVGDRVGAVRNLVDNYEADGDGVLNLVAEEGRFPAVRVITEQGRAYHRSWVERVFEPSLSPRRGAAREQLLVQLIVATDLLTWKLLRREIGLSRAKTEATIVEMLNALTGGS